MHGNGGGSFFTSTSRKKAKVAVGFLEGACKFVVVTPLADWTWKQEPRPWVTELVGALRALRWVDHRRVYLTGSSMGGMGTWELGAARPEFFAAVAPVAAYTRPSAESGSRPSSAECRRSSCSPRP